MTRRVDQAITRLVELEQAEAIAKAMRAEFIAEITVARRTYIAQALGITVEAVAIVEDGWVREPRP